MVSFKVSANLSITRKNISDFDPSANLQILAGDQSYCYCLSYMYVWDKEARN